MMGGAIWMESQPGQGSKFHFTLRLALQDAPAPRAELLQSEELRGLRALIVDDNLTHRTVLTGMLTRWGMQPTAVEGGQAALEALEIAKSNAHPYHMVLLDGQMPEMDGFALAELIRKDPALVSGAIMMVTSAGRLGDAARCRELGISTYLLKTHLAKRPFASDIESNKKRTAAEGSADHAALAARGTKPCTCSSGGG